MKNITEQYIDNPIEITNRSKAQTYFLLGLLDGNLSKLIKLEIKIKNNFIFYCPGDKEECERILNTINKSNWFDMKISFDFDGTLDREYIQEYAKSLIDRGFEVIVCTTRYEPEYKHSWGGIEWGSTDIKEVCDKIGIKKVLYTNMKSKYEILKNYNILFHLDNDRIETELLNENMITGIYLDENWKEKCEKFI